MKCDVAKIRCLIATTGKDEAEFLHSVGLGAKTLNRWEKGTETPREDFVGFIARKLGVNISEFASCEENKSAQAIQKPQTSWQNKKKRTASNNTDDTKTNNPQIITDAKRKNSNSTREKSNAKEALALPSNVCEEPASTILIAKLCLAENKKAIGSMAIVVNEHEQCSAKGIYWVGRTLPAAVLAAVLSDDQCFFYKKVKYQVIDYVAYRDADKYLKIISRFSNPSAPQTVYVFSQKNIAHFQQDRYEMVTAMIPCSKRIYPVSVTVFYDKEKQQYFINEATYTEIRKQHGLPYLRLQAVKESGASFGFAALNPHSELNLLGYNVSSAEGLSTDHRRKILRDAIDSGVLWKGEVIKHLEWLIHTRENTPNMENAVGEWKSDLIYISRYQASEQRNIWVSKFKSRFSEGIIF